MCSEMYFHRASTRKRKSKPQYYNHNTHTQQTTYNRCPNYEIITPRFLYEIITPNFLYFWITAFHGGILTSHFVNVFFRAQRQMRLSHCTIRCCEWRICLSQNQIFNMLLLACVSGPVLVCLSARLRYHICVPHDLPLHWLKMKKHVMPHAGLANNN